MNALELERLKRFIIEAHANTYASDTGKPIDPCRLGSTDFRYEKGNFVYLDSYFGGRRFIGEEVVYGCDFFGTNVTWGMNYFGTVPKEAKMDHKPIYSFLKKCLRVGVEDGIPFRGPNCWATETFKYECIVDGDLSFFSGEEMIYYREGMVYIAKFHGGLIE